MSEPETSVQLDRPTSAEVGDLLRHLPQAGQELDVFGLEAGAAAFVLAETLKANPRPALVVTESFQTAENLCRDLEFFLAGNAGLVTALFPPQAHSAFSSLPAHAWTSARRIRALWRLCGGAEAAVVVAPVQALLLRLMPVQALRDFADLILEGEELDRQVLLTKLVQGGYSPSALVEEPGDMAIRGGIVDVFGPLEDEPVRLEFYGDFVDSLRLFKPSDQRSIKSLKETILLPSSEVILGPANLARGREGLARLEADVAKILSLREPLTVGRPFNGIQSFLPLFYEKTSGPWDYLDQRGLVCLMDPAALGRAAEDWLAGLQDRVAELAGDRKPYLPLPEIAFSWPEVLEDLGRRPRINFRTLALESHSPSLHFVSRPAREMMSPAQAEDESPLAPLIRTLRRLEEREVNSWLVCRTEGQLKRLLELLAGYGLAGTEEGTFEPEESETGRLHMVLGALSAGFFLPERGFLVLTEEEALGQTRPKTLTRPSPSLPLAQLASYSEMSPGDLVVHQDHGIGHFVGLVNLKVNDQRGDYILLEYQGQDKLYVPVDRFNLIQKYIGPEGKKPSLDRLGGTAWQTAKRRVKRAIMEIVRELVELYATRKVAPGFAYSGRDETLREFETTFEFEETIDQARVIDEVLKDMADSRPMDRLVCGDVGYGKTEVALRAAFRSVMDGKQVAVLVPTTVLAEQHGQTFSNRLTPYPVRVEVLSRFKTVKAQKEILQGLEAGQVDVVIGTHRLLSQDVIFKDLGLVIVDEEHRFGVDHKEKLKQFRKTVDVLALTATPIPRTLQMSMLSIRDLSVIDTPPLDRQPITTHLSLFDPAVIQEAISREIARGGQIFFVHNRVQDILKLANQIQRLVPLARIEVAHGQMSERVLEKVMLKFIRREVDVLVCTTIIESGLDIPSANTIIINNADKLGLAQIYQLRGRVGRSAEKAYAYLLIPEETDLTRDAHKRLKVLMEFSDLGAGFKIALHDLQIRGGGNLLGRAQSGQVAQVGYEMYLGLIEEAVAELKGDILEKPLDPEVKLPFSAFLPEDYVAEPRERLLLYRRLAGVADEAELNELLAEITDRFGPPPQEAANLAEAVRLKLDLRRLGVVRLEAVDGQAVLAFGPKPGVRPEALFDLVRSAPRRLKLTPEAKLIVLGQDPVAEVKKVIGRLLASCQPT